MAKVLAMYQVVGNVLANAGVEVSVETAKQIRQVCNWTNVKSMSPVLEDAVMDFYLLSIKYFRLLHKRGTYVSDDWLARNMVKAFRQNRDENKFGGVIHLLKDYAQKETNAFLKGELDSVDFTLEPEDQFIGAINSWIRDGFVTTNGEALRSRLVKLFNLDANTIIMHVSKDGTAESFRLVSAFGQKDSQINVEAETNLADECQVADSSVPTAEPVRTTVNPALKRIAAVAMGTNMPVGPLAQNPFEVKVQKSVVPSVVKKDAAEDIKAENYWDEFIAKYPNKDVIDKFAVLLARSAYMIHARAKARAEGHPYSSIKVENKEIIDLLFDNNNDNDYLRRAALKKPLAKVAATAPVVKKNWKDDYDKFDILLVNTVVKDGAETKTEYKLRIWIDKTKPEPTGIVYINDNAKHPFMKFHWGFKKDGLSFPKPRVTKKVVNSNDYEDITMKSEYEFAVNGIHKFLIANQYFPKRAPGAVKPGITMQNWGCKVINQ